MLIEILVVPDCPHQRLAEQQLSRALTDLGLAATDFTTRVVADLAEAARLGFTGSPTILIDGCDPFAEPGDMVSFTCRLYRTPSGLEGAPGRDQLRRILREAGATNRSVCEGDTTTS
ncbi:hypothetical protein [Nocardia sp. CNY236]|uniref:DsbA family protein n=1 Tax=Nocardia sp. CNY236 TaxID=1169152 RepID=UPI00042498F9|nr:hypothetical protein [Nocardia sp. CNY236]